MKITLLLLTLTFFLAGCTDTLNAMFDPLGYSSLEKGTAKVCEQSPVLLTNLQTSSSERQYLLPNGRVCTFKK